MKELLRNQVFAGFFRPALTFFKRNQKKCKNASVTIYDEDDNMYKIASRTRKHKFICRMKNDEPFIKEKKSDSEHKKPKSNHKTSTETTHDPSHKGHDPSQKGHYQSRSIC